MDKAAWKQIGANKGALPDGYTITELTPELLAMLGSPDPELRDDVAYMVFAYWVAEDKRYSPDEVRSLMGQLTANLDVGLGEQGTDTVLLRSFSALILSLIAYRDVVSPFLEVTEIQALLDKMLAYLAAEADLRGYVEGTGWHHAVAHTADVLKFLARNSKTTADDHLRILNAIADKLTAPVKHIYVHDEDERLVRAVVDIVQRGLLDKAAFVAWLGRFKAWRETWKESGQFVVTIHAPYMNCKHFIRSLYLTMDALSQKHALAAALKGEVENLIPVFGAGTIYMSG